MSMKKDLKELQRKAERAGFVIRHRPNGHHSYYTADGTWVACSASTPSDARGLLNLRASLRRAGLPR